MSTFRNSRGQWFATGRGGTYRINDGDPQNYDEDFDEDRANEEWDAAEIDYHEHKENNHR